MKTKLLITIICACSLFKTQGQTQEWEYVCSLTGESLCKVYAQGTDTVYVVGENGLIAKSTDKGLTWDKKYFSGKETLNDIIFCNHDVGFIVGNNGTILRTQNAGSSWEQMTSGTVLNITAIATFDLNNIWAVGNRSLIVHSTDMGETWITKSFLSATTLFRDIKCNGSRGYITGGEVVLKTEDAGATWEEQILTGYGGIHSLSITDNKVYALGDNKIIFTEDNVNWDILNAAVWGSKTALYFQDDQNGFVTTYDITTCGGCEIGSWIFKTTNGGNSWEEVYSGSIAPISDFAFSSNNEFGYCVVGKYLMRTPYSGEFYYCKGNVGMNVIKSENPVQILNQEEKELQINSYSMMIDRVEIITIDGRKIMQKTEQAKILNININSLPKGVYLINVLFSDKTSYFSKWIKN